MADEITVTPEVIERLARIWYNAAVYSEEDGWWDRGVPEDEKEEMRRGVRAVLRELGFYE